MIFSGTLYYEDSSDILKFDRLIIREDSISFQATTTWDAWGKWTVDSRAVKSGLGYETIDAIAHQLPNRSNSCKLAFTGIETDEDGANVTGFWEENGSEYKFSGYLDRIR